MPFLATALRQVGVTDVVPGPFWRLRHTGAAPPGGYWDFEAQSTHAGFVGENDILSGTNYANAANRLGLKWLNGAGVETGWTPAGTPSGDPWQGGSGRRYTDILGADTNYSIQLELLPIIPRMIRYVSRSTNVNRLPGTMQLEWSLDEATWNHWATLTNTGTAPTAIYDFLSITEGGTIAATES